MNLPELTRVQENSNKYLFSTPLRHYSYQSYRAHPSLTQEQKMSVLSDLIREKKIIIIVIPDTWLRFLKATFAFIRTENQTSTLISLF